LIGKATRKPEDGRSSHDGRKGHFRIVVGTGTLDGCDGLRS